MFVRLSRRAMAATAASTGVGGVITAMRTLGGILKKCLSPRCFTTNPPKLARNELEKSKTSK